MGHAVALVFTDLLAIDIFKTGSFWVALGDQAGSKHTKNDHFAYTPEYWITGVSHRAWPNCLFS